LGVTAHAPAHRERGYLGHALHRLDGTVAGLAREADLYVPLVREVDEAGKLVDPHPWNRLLAIPVVVDLLDLGVALSGDDLVAPHAPRDGRHAGEDAAPGVSVAELTVDPVRSRVDRMTELDGLDRSRGDELDRALEPWLVGRVGQGAHVRDHVT